jgi:hypothetical protein
MADKPLGSMMFPRVLYGTSRDVRAAWRKISRRIAKAGTWEPTLSELEFVDASILPGEILIGRPMYGGARNPHENHWRLYHCVNFESHYKPNSRDDLEDDPKARLIVDGMRYLWFALAMWDCSSGDLPIDHRMTDQTLAVRFPTLIAEGFMKWIDLIVAVSPRLATEVFDPSRYVATYGRCWWFIPVIVYAQRAAEREPIHDFLKDIDRDFDGDCVAWLIAKRLVERTDIGYKLVYPDGKQSR